MFKDKELSVFHKNTMLGEARIISFILCGCCWLFYYLIQFSCWKNQYKNHIIVYEGSVEDLIEKLYALGIELDRKIDRHYFFVKKSNTMTDIRYFVTDIDDSCKVRGSKRDVKALELDLKLHFIKNITSTE